MVADGSEFAIAMPTPPYDLSVSPGANMFFMVFTLVVFTASVVVVMHLLVRYCNPLLLVAIAGGTAAALIEPIVNARGVTWYPRDSYWIAFHAFGRGVPLWILLGFGFFVGVNTVIAYELYRRGKMRKLWILYGAGWVADVAMESVGCSLNVWRYYGPQPFIAAIIPVCCGALVGAVGRPVFLTVNSGVSALLIWTAGLVTIFLALTVTTLTIASMSESRVRNA